jgi:acetyl-CoA carboxylase alpha subunit
MKERWSTLAGAVASEDIVDVIVNEMALGVDWAVECWMAEIDHALADPQLTSLGRLHAVQEILEKYKSLTGKSQLKERARLGLHARLGLQKVPDEL